MKIAIFSRPRSIYTKEEIEDLLSSLKKYNFESWFNRDFAQQITRLTQIEIDPRHIYRYSDPLSDEIEMVVSFGGDGTFLDCVKMVYGSDRPIIGINSGRLGFLAMVTKQETDSLFSDIVNGNYTLEKRTLLKIECDKELEIEHPYAFNEFTVQREGAEMVKAEVYVDKDYISSYWGDGVILSTPSGSTAYSLSVGGPVVSPQCRCMVLSPIASHNLTMRPIILEDSSQVSFAVGSRDNSDLFISIDNRKFIVPSKSVFRVSKAEKSIYLLAPQNISFYNTLRKKMMWGFDGRESEDQNI